MIHQQEEEKRLLRIGSLILHSIGQLLPHQLQTNKFNTRDYIFPVSTTPHKFLFLNQFLVTKKIVKTWRDAFEVIEINFSHLGRNINLFLKKHNYFWRLLPCAVINKSVTYAHTYTYITKNVFWWYFKKKDKWLVHILKQKRTLCLNIIKTLYTKK